MASPAKTFIDATGITLASNDVRFSAKNNVIMMPKQLNNTIMVSTQAAELVSRFTIVLPLLSSKSLFAISRTSITFKDSFVRQLLITTFPPGYHESAKQRPTEGLIFPRKRNKNY